MWHSVASRDDAGKADGSGGPDPSGVDDDEDDDADEKKKTKGSLLLLLLLLVVLLPLLRRALHLRAVVLKACIISIAISIGKEE